MAFCINTKTTKNVLKQFLNDIELKKPIIFYKKYLAFSPASQQKTAAERYVQTLTRFNKPMAFPINSKTTKNFLKYSLNYIQLKKPTIVYK